MMNQPRRGSNPLNLRRLTRLNQLDFEFALWQLLYLCINPSRVYRNLYYQKQTKNRWARDDPAFILILCACVCLAAIGYGVAYGVGVIGLLRLVLYMVLIEFLGVGLLLSTMLWYVRPCVNFACKPLTFLYIWNPDTLGSFAIISCLIIPRTAHRKRWNGRTHLISTAMHSFQPFCLLMSCSFCFSTWYREIAGSACFSETRCTSPPHVFTCTIRFSGTMVCVWTTPSLPIGSASVFEEDQHISVPDWRGGPAIPDLPGDRQHWQAGASHIFRSVVIYQKDYVDVTKVKMSMLRSKFISLGSKALSAASKSVAAGTAAAATSKKHPGKSLVPPWL